MGLGAGLFGAVIGGLFGGPLGAVIGGSIGMMLSGLSSSAGNMHNYQNSAFNLMAVFFQCLGKLAKSDGRVSENEAEYVRELLHSMNIDSAVRKLLIAEFNSGRDSSESFESMVRRLANLIGDSGADEFRVQAIQIFCSLVVIDRHVDEKEFQMLQTAGFVLGCIDEVDRFFAGYDHSQRSENYSTAPQSDLSLDKCYALLGVTSDASDDQVKKAYRKKAMKFHPDKAQAAGLSAVMIEEAKKNFQDISNAYETIRKVRGMK